MGKPAKSGKAARGHRADDIPKDFYKRCLLEHAFCAKLSDNILSKMTKRELVTLNCGKPIDFTCRENLKTDFRESCHRWVTPIGDETKVQQCIKANIVRNYLAGCGKNPKSQKRAANLSGDASSSVAIWASVGVVLFLLICALIAWWYLKGYKKGDGRQAKGATKSVKSKMTTGKSKLGSRKSQVASRKSLGSKAGSRKGSKASKGSAKKSRRSVKKK